MSGDKLEELFNLNGIPLSESQVWQFQTYHEELLKWNSRANLISKKDESRILERHFLESALLSLFDEFKESAEVLDLGTGGGFPGVPLKIVCPHLTLTLLDSKRWKMLFLKDLVSKLKLENVQVVCERAEDLAQKGGYGNRFDLVVSRAVTELKKLYEWAAPFMKEDAVLIALKGSRISEEMGELKTEQPDLSVEVRPLFRGMSEMKNQPQVVFVRSKP